MRPLPSGWNPPSMTNGAPMERFGPCKTQHGAYRGPFWAALSRFVHPKVHFGRIEGRNRDLTISWATAESRGHFSQVQPPLFVVSKPWSWPLAHTHPQPELWHPAVPLAHCGLLGSLWAKKRDLAVSWATWLNRKPEGFPQGTAPRFHLRMAQSMFWPPALPLAPLWAVVGWGPRGYGWVGGLKIIIENHQFSYFYCGSNDDKIIKKTERAVVDNFGCVCPLQEGLWGRRGCFCSGALRRGIRAAVPWCPKGVPCRGIRVPVPWCPHSPAHLTPEGV